MKTAKISAGSAAPCGRAIMVAGCCLLAAMCFFSGAVFGQAQTELGSEGDLTVLGTGGTALDPNTEIKGFTVFGTTQAAYPGAVISSGSVVVNGYLAVSSGAYFVGGSTFASGGAYFTGISSFSHVGSIYVNGGTAGQVMTKIAGGAMQWSTPVPDSGGDNLGSHIATMTLNMQNFAITNVSTITMANGSIAIVPQGTGGSNDSYGISIGSNAYDNYNYGVGVGVNVYNNSNSGVGVGLSASGNNDSGVGVGPGAFGNNNYGVGVGASAYSNNNNGVGVGFTAASNYNFGMGAGYNASNNSSFGVGVGPNANNNTNYGVGVGANSQNNFNYGTGVGAYTSSRSSAAALGYYARANQVDSLALGAGANANAVRSVCIGAYCVNNATDTAKIREGYTLNVDSINVSAVVPRLTISTNVFIVGYSSAAKYYGDGSSLSGIGGALNGGQTPLLPYWTSATGLGNSSLARDSSTSLTAMNSTFTVQGSAFSVGGSTLVVRNGNVGIGTTDPSARLHVSGGGVRIDNMSTAGFVKNDASGNLSGGNTVADADIPPAITRDTEWDTVAELNAASTDADVLATNSTWSGGDLSGTGLAPQVADDSHNHGDGTIANNLTLDNITQITSRAHSGLGSLTTGDDHTQYALLAGRGTGQTLNGGTAAGNNLTLDSTSNGAKGYVLLNPAGGNVGIGTAALAANTKLGILGNGVSIGGPESATDASLHIKASYGGMDRLTQISPGAVASKPALNIMASTDGGSSNQWWAWGVDTDNTWKIQPGIIGFGGSTGLFINSAGSVGIGTTAPMAKLDVNGSIRIPDDTSIGKLQIGSIGSYLSRQSSDGSTILQTAQAYLLFNPAGNNVGIGMMSPGYKLSISGPSIGTGTGALQLTTPGTAQGERSAISLYSTFQGTGDNGPRRTADIIAGYQGSAWGNEYLSFNIGSAGDSALVTSEKMRITSAGNVGVGTAAPGTKLAVMGGNNINSCWPDGLAGTPIAMGITGPTAYTVPTGYNLYLTHIYSADASTRLKISAYYAWRGDTTTTSTMTFACPVIAGAGMAVGTQSTSYTADIFGLLVPASVSPVALSLAGSSAYTVPAGYNLYITHVCGGDDSARLKVNSYYATKTLNLYETYNFTPPLIAGAGMYVGSSSASYYINVFGYLTRSDGTGGY